MFKWKIMGLALLACGCLLASACGGGGEAESTPTGVSVVVVTPSGPATPRVRRTPTPTPVMTSTPLQVCGPNPDPVTSAQLQVQEPVGQAQVRIPFHLRGWVSRGVALTQTPTATPPPTPVPDGQTPQTPSPTSESTPLDLRGVTLALVDQKQNVVQTNDLPLSPRDFRIAPPGLQVTDTTRPFAADVVLKDIKEPTPFCLWVFLDTTEDGKARGVLQIPVVVLPQ